MKEETTESLAHGMPAQREMRMKMAEKEGGGLGTLTTRRRQGCFVDSANKNASELLET